MKINQDFFDLWRLFEQPIENRSGFFRSLENDLSQFDILLVRF